MTLLSDVVVASIATWTRPPSWCEWPQDQRRHRHIHGVAATQSPPAEQKRAVLRVRALALPALNHEDTQSLVDIPLSTNNSTTRVTLPSPTDRA